MPRVLSFATERSRAPDARHHGGLMPGSMQESVRSVQTAWPHADESDESSQLIRRLRTPRNRRIVAAAAGALCVAGLCAALALPTGDATTMPLSSTMPTTVVGDPKATSTTPHDFAELPDDLVNSPSTDVDPRAFVMERAMAGQLGGSTGDWADASAEVVSRNGDIVLVALRATTRSGAVRTVNVLLVNTETSWVVRDVYAEAQAGSTLN